MKICWDNLEKLRFTSNGTWHNSRGNTYIYYNACENCNEPFLGIKDRNVKYCCNQCCGRTKTGNNNVFTRRDIRKRLKQIDRSYLKGEKNHNWKGGICKDNPRASWEIVFWRESVYKRDNYTCQECNQYGGDLNAHHIRSVSKYPDLIFDVDNGITLCVDCHRKTFGKEKLFEEKYIRKIK